ncbi:hypothetical protein J2Z62_000767 [Mycoplasmoides fastidiosum]|uniref:Uncharacterized protein n=1 Tax=Mycoplasmoides fastidiosum TaxID=92758 RepID=A0ABU0M043_9BACT|nr:hypothetical protein [Mycoplasmoides fastidiosum]MDQ0514329.1 hypothetical protein [Mycoplasmoides fastidiosum]UUD38068.1 hypothetical protein NPA10_01590 [Mycoplasmoides fastidiosum]
MTKPLILHQQYQDWICQIIIHQPDQIHLPVVVLSEFCLLKQQTLNLELFTGHPVYHLNFSPVNPNQEWTYPLLAHLVLEVLAELGLTKIILWCEGSSFILGALLTMVKNQIQQIFYWQPHIPHLTNFQHWQQLHKTNQQLGLNFLAPGLNQIVQWSLLNNSIPAYLITEVHDCLHQFQTQTLLNSAHNFYWISFQPQKIKSLIQT